MSKFRGAMIAALFLGWFIALGAAVAKIYNNFDAVMLTLTSQAANIPPSDLFMGFGIGMTLSAIVIIGLYEVLRTKK